MALDPDIAAADALELARLNAQGLRDMRQASILSMQQLAAMASHEAEDIADTLDYKRQLILVLAGKYMTTSTATTQGAIDVDAANDAARLKAAYLAVLAVQG